jgi:hypothetical protein
LEARRLLPYIVGLLVLAFALGSLPRSEPGGSILFRSYWLLYLVYLGPIVILGLLVALIALIVLNWRGLSEGIGYGLAKRLRKRKPRSRVSFVVAALFWALALGVLLARGCTPICKPGASSTLTTQIIGENSTVTSILREGDAVPVLSGLVQTTWFSFAFLGLVFVCGIVIIQSIRVALKEKSDVNQGLLLENREESLEAVQEALKLVHDQTTDPRSRIIACYRHLISVAMRMGAPVSSDQTARELETGIRTMLGLEGPAMSGLTLLFEEARYSLHPITEDDSQRAYQYLQSVAGELRVQMTPPL